jgi:hypothetical protein
MSASGQYQMVCSTHSPGIYVSNNFGSTFMLNNSVSTVYFCSISMTASGQYITAINNASVYVSIDYGNNFVQQVNTSIISSSLKFVSVSASGQYQLIGPNNNAKLYVSTSLYNTINGYPIATTNPQNGNLVIGSSFTSNTGYSNTALGLNALNVNTTGNNNTALGYEEGNTITTGSNNMCLGYNAQASSDTVSDEITLGNSSITKLRCAASLTSLSDARDKKNINPLPVGLDFISDLNPVEFDWNMRDGGKVNIHEFGFIAQELKANQEKLGITVPNLVYDSNPDRLEASYGTLIPIMVKAIKELKSENNTFKSEIEILKSEIEILKHR